MMDIACRWPRTTALFATLACMLAAVQAAPDAGNDAAMLPFTCTAS